jgi:hypothetical protein
MRWSDTDFALDISRLIVSVRNRIAAEHYERHLDAR